jgi:succinyl-CoA synthetase alpha subunit
MPVFLSEDSKIIVQGMTGAEGRKHTARMLAAGSAVVGGVTPGKGGQVVEIGGLTLPVSGSSGTAAAKKEALEAAGVKVGKTPSETAELARVSLGQLVS